MQDVTPWHDYPMGPTLQGYLGISDEDYIGRQAKPSPERDDDFRVFFSAYLTANPIDHEQMGVGIMEELNLMDLPDMAFAVFDQTFGPDQAESSYDISMAAGTTLFMLGEAARGESYFLAAYEISPEEVGPMVNLAQICYAGGRDDEALEWIEAGLALNKNHQKLWELLASLKMAKVAGDNGPTDVRAPEFTSVYKEVMAKAFQMNSYLGVALACDLLYGDAPELKQKELAKLYDGGVREPYFLVEYTAILGECQQYQQLVQVVWQAMTDQGGSVAWQVIAHGAQGHLAMSNKPEAEKLYAALSRRDDVPEQHLTELRRQLDE